MDSSKAQRKLSLVEMSRQAIETRILNGDLLPGQHLIEAELANQLGISRTPLREALRQLETRGLVKKRNAIGYVVVYHTLKDIQDTLEVRLSLERTAIELACEHATQEQIDRASTFLARFDEELAKPNQSIPDMDKLLNSNKDWNSLFHKELYNAAGNELLTTYIMNLRDLDRLKRMTLKLTPKDFRRFQTQHHAILNAVKQMDKTKAKKAVQAHIKTLYNFYFKLY